MYNTAQLRQRFHYPLGQVTRQEVRICRHSGLECESGDFALNKRGALLFDHYPITCALTRFARSIFPLREEFARILVKSTQDFADIGLEYAAECPREILAIR